MFIAVPTGVKIFNWISTLWKGKIKLTTPMLFAIGFVAMFTIGGLSGVTHAVVPSDTQQTDTYYIVAHFHYVLFGGSMFGLFAGIYYWFPKVVGHLLNDKMGKVHFALMFTGFNLTFAPMHILGLQGMPRRIYTYPEGQGWDMWNFVSTVGSFLIATSILVFIYNVWASRRNQPAGADPWDARTLEWAIPSPPPEYNFAEIPLVTARDDLWHQKYAEDEQGRPVKRELPEETEQEEHHIHLPSPSYWPIFTAFGLPVICYGMIYKNWVLAAFGGIWTMSGIYAWGLEPSTAPEEPDTHPAVAAEPKTDPEPVASDAP
jgi:cytochrome c oxidase subunit 1